MKQLKSLIQPLRQNIKILKSTTDNIYFNLATQQYLFQKAEIKAPTLMLWRNDKTIVIGKHQNPWKECRIGEMNANKVLLSRRKTGGGAVYQDLGNTCFSFFTPHQANSQYDFKAINNSILIQTLCNLGVQAQVSGRNDITYKDKKISGSAYRLHLGGPDGVGRKALHHGTVLFSVDTNALLRYLNPNKKKLQSKGVDSVVSRVMNINQQFPQLNHEIFCTELAKQFSDFYNQKPQIQKLNTNQLQKNKQISANFERLSSWQWLYGQSPDFKYSIEKKFDWALVQILFNVHEGFIQQVKVFSDCLIPDFITILNQEIKGIKYDINGIQQELRNKLKNKDKGEIQGYQLMVNDICNWIKSQL